MAMTLEELSCWMGAVEEYVREEREALEERNR